MIKIIFHLIIFLTKNFLTLEIKVLRETVLLLPNINNIINPFSIKSEKEIEIVKLKIDCDSNLNKLVEFPNSNICKENNLEKNWDQIQYFLNNINIKLKNEKKFEDNLIIDYELTFLKNEKEKKFNFNQILKIGNKIPIIILNNNLIIKNHFKEEILFINNLYFQNSKKENISLIFEHEKSKLVYSIIDNILFFDKIDKSLINKNFKYYLKDSKTNLKSDLFNISYQYAVSSFKLEIVFLIMFLILIFFGIIFYLYFKNKLNNSFKNDSQIDILKKSERFFESSILNSKNDLEVINIKNLNIYEDKDLKKKKENSNDSKDINKKTENFEKEKKKLKEEVIFDIKDSKINISDIQDLSLMSKVN